ncbi:hypothetical protein FOA43_002942 [Brettanomyces nanus]|uniref:Conserved oligomeric Golgi complex subunit 4 n=1 Tax=Eeniella nana TaxID=13502 RepID=A0A875S5F2_EENNA|nr:uncharacterized protein FOA43_002942 [Brettanomyces nanus]QPG75585.1 hypothetical protein FOA43_002942 [Brettanomyces nanus]
MPIRSKLETRHEKADEYLAESCLQKKTSHQSQIRSLEMTRMELFSTLERSRSLKEKLDNSSGLSTKITEKVRLLDSEKTKIQKIKDYVEHVIVLKTEIQKADEFIRHEQWKEAATSISIIRSLPGGLIHDSFVQSVVPTSDIPEMPEEIVSGWINKLRGTFLGEFNSSASTRNVERLTYFFQLFPLIGEEQLGMDCYSKFVCSIISEQSRAILRNLPQAPEESNFYASILFQLYQTVASIVNQHSRVIRKYYGDSVMPQILTQIQSECDLQSGLTFDTFWESKRIDEVVSRVQQYAYPVLVNLIYNGGASADDSMDTINDSRPSIDLNALGEDTIQSTPSLAEIGAYTDEISAMMNYWAMYCKFYVVTWNESSSRKDAAQSIYPKPLLLSSFMDKINNHVTTKFDVLSTFAVRRTIEKACQLEQVPSFVPQLAQCAKYLSEMEKNHRNSSNKSLHSLLPEEAPVSSLIDDVTMALNVILSEALSTGQFICIKALISNVKRILENDFMNIMNQKFSRVSLRANSTLLTRRALENVREYIDRENIRAGGGKTMLRRGTGKSKTANDSAIAASRGSLLVKSINAAISMANEEGVGSDSGDDKALVNFIIVLNSVSTFGQYLGKLSEHLIEHLEEENLLILDDQEYKRVFKELEVEGSNSSLIVNLKSSKGTPEKPSVQDRIETIVSSLSSSFTEKADALIDSQIGVLFNQVLRSRLINMINETFQEESYLVSSEMLSANMNDISEAIIQFIQDWNRLSIPYLTTMTKQNFNILIKKLISFIAAHLESKIWAMDKKCNELGSANLEKDVSVLISEITKYNYSLRDDFVRVTQIIMLLGLDDDEETEDLKDLDWALSPNERSRARDLRVDRKVL